MEEAFTTLRTRGIQARYRGSMVKYFKVVKETKMIYHIKNVIFN